MKKPEFLANPLHDYSRRSEHDPVNYAGSIEHPVSKDYHWLWWLSMGLIAIVSLAIIWSTR